MKNIIYVTFICLSYNSLAQNPQLFENTWILHELTLDGETISSPDSTLNAELIFDEDEESITILQDSCDPSTPFNGGIASYNGMISFNLLVFGNPFGSTCDNMSTLDFLFDHASFYEEPIPNPFNYEITEDSGVITLTITNGNDDTAIYRNIPLSIEENNLKNIKLVYHKKIETLSFIGALFQGLQATVYSITGQKKLATALDNNATIEVSDLAKGVYFVSLSTTDNQRGTYKFIKY